MEKLLLSTTSIKLPFNNTGKANSFSSTATAKKDTRTYISPPSCSVEFSSSSLSSSPGGTLSTGTLSFSDSLTIRASPTQTIPSPSLSVADESTADMIIHKHKNKIKLSIKSTDEKSSSSSYSSSYARTIDKTEISFKSKNNNNNNNNKSAMRADRNDGNGTRVWIKKTAIEAFRNPRLSFKEKMTRKPSMISSSFNSGSVLHGSVSTPFSRQTSFTSANGSVASFSSQRDLFGDSDSDIGSIGVTSFMQNINRSGEWGWAAACMIDSSDGNITLQLDDSPVNSSSSDTSSASILSSSSSTGISNNNNNDQTVILPASALSDGDIVMANNYELSNDGNPICPDDLISLSHLHEPAVVECLQHRYEDNRIYTATGPVLLVLNPFQNIRGLYEESTMEQYWEKSERQSKEILPPHVYAIADEAFRSMMRSLEQSLGGTGETSCDQSILVSGESGAGKTVTTKFVMKYLAALSQRAGSQTKEKRAYEKVADDKKRRSGSNITQSYPSVTSSKSSSTPSWVSRSKRSDADFSGDRSSSGSGSNNIIFGESSDGLSNVTSLVGSSASNSIEAQVLQSNPILESFGNARTMRNDNSSRFGKFIEIQFTRTGRLVGAQIDTYLLEKVRLVTQSIGERNYHIFYEMLSGSMKAEELRNYFIASTASPDDFRITASGTYDRRDGVSDKDTCRALKAAMKTMKFSTEEQRGVFAAAAAILHASNLTFCDLGEYCSLDAHNVHLEPVCHLFGVTADDLNQALCHFSITAGKDTQVQQNLDIDKAEKGLEALLKATYGALFTYLVTRINDSICYSPDQNESLDENGDRISSDGTHSKDVPSASIGVLDIFGFESFKSNSFEQLCINYCNEALQQQFNAFVLKNEQAEYEREGIEWSFIEFPENQDVIDLIDNRGSGILCILDDQCRAPGTSDRSFALDVYNKCKNQTRFSANRKQTAALQFCVHHFAGPVEYTTNGFVEKNRDELPKEAIEILQNSFNPFMRLLSNIMENSCAERNSNSNSNVCNRSKMRRQESSSFGRATVGGQFRRQLKRLREKIDIMSPHYVRCLKPNDELVPNHFDRAAVAEQLRCGGILEAVRVARAGYSNHYSHSEFLRRYRCLGWDALKALKTQDRIRGSPQPRKKFFPGAVNICLPSSGSSSVDSSVASTTTSDSASCKTLMKHLCRLLQLELKDENNENEKNSANIPSAPVARSPSSQVQNYAYQISTPSPSWAGRGSGSIRESNNGSLPSAPFASSLPSPSKSIWDKKPAPDFRPPSTPEIKRRSISKNTCGTTSESAKVGVQIGKTKVFLRHKAFECLERLRSQEQSLAAVKINSTFRMFLARVAYVHVRNTVRKSMLDLQAFQNDDWKEFKKNDADDERLIEFFNRLDRMRHSFNGQNFSLVEVWASQMRESIHNPTPRSEWGMDSPSRPFRWMLVDGLWTKNHDLCDGNS